MIASIAALLVVVAEGDGNGEGEATGVGDGRTVGLGCGEALSDGFPEGVAEGLAVGEDALEVAAGPALEVVWFLGISGGLGGAGAAGMLPPPP